MRWPRFRVADERAIFGRRSRVVLAPRCWRQIVDNVAHCDDDGGKKARLTKSTKETVKTIRVRECRVIPAGLR
jgi:hypothetical protein